MNSGNPGNSGFGLGFGLGLSMNLSQNVEVKIEPGNPVTVIQLYDHVNNVLVRFLTSENVTTLHAALASLFAVSVFVVLSISKPENGKNYKQKYQREETQLLF